MIDFRRARTGWFERSANGRERPSLSLRTDTVTLRKSLLWSLLDRYASLAIGIVSTMVLARLLTPAELGTYSVAMALVSVAATLRDVGAGNYLVQEKDLTVERVRSVWALQLGMGVLLALVVASISGVGAEFYGEPTIRWILLLLAANFLINPFGSLTYAFLMRDMRFDALAIMRFTSTLSGAIVSVVLALRGWGAVSLAWGGLTATVTNALVALYYRPKQYGWLPGVRELRRVLSFGTGVTAMSILNTVSTSAPEFLLAKASGLASAGLYSRANGLVALFARLVIDGVYSVALSMFAQHARDGKDYSTGFVRSIAYVTVLSWSFCAALAVMAYPVIHLLYGEQWLGSVVATRWLALATALTAPVALCTAALIGGGRLRLLVRATSFTAAATVLAAATAAWSGLEVMCVALVVASGLSIAAWLAITRQEVQFRWDEMTRGFAKSAIVGAMTGCGSFASVAIGGWEPSKLVWPLAAGALGACVAFFAGILLVRHPLRHEITNLLQHARRLRRGFNG